jgi:EAL domain-containing protein (putative c-di-GMP-specific phosphodiesterase class I)
MDSDTLIKNAEAAMYRAKQLGRNSYRLYQPEANARAFERQTLVTALKRALDREEFVLHYQPQVNVQTGKIDVVEALLRWRHPEMGLVEPSAFLPAAEEGQLMNAIGQWVMREVCRQLKLWQQLGLRPITMGVNLSPRQFGHADLLRMVERSILEFGIDPSLIELEISQEAVNDPDNAVPRLTALKKIGVRIAIDDFGTGRTALSDLKRLPIDAVKIDKGFIRNVTTQSDDAAIVEAVIRMARGFDIRVVAEGVETKDQMTFLWNRRCTDMQGFFFGKPLPAAALEETLRMQH